MGAIWCFLPSQKQLLSARTRLAKMARENITGDEGEGEGEGEGDRKSVV